MKQILIVLDFLDKKTQEKITDFRKKASTMSGRVRTKEEEVVHNDKYCSNGDIKKWIVILEEDEVVGVTAVFGRKVIFNDRKIFLGGIGKVRVRDDKRRMGLASKMMNEAMKQLEEINADIAYLCTDMNSFLVKFYEKYGFLKMNQPYSFLSKSGKRYVENEGMISPIKSEKIFDKVMEDRKPFDIGIGNW